MEPNNQYKRSHNGEVSNTAEIQELHKSVLNMNLFYFHIYFTWHSWSAHMLPIASSPEFPVAPQNRQTPDATPAGLLRVPSRNSTIAFSVHESANAITQNNLVRPHPSCKSTLIASSSSLHT
jgi:hypothetical protein